MYLEREIMSALPGNNLIKNKKPNLQVKKTMVLFFRYYDIVVLRTVQY